MLCREAVISVSVINVCDERGLQTHVCYLKLLSFDLQTVFLAMSPALGGLLSFTVFLPICFLIHQIYYMFAFLALQPNYQSLISFSVAAVSLSNQAALSSSLLSTTSLAVVYKIHERKTSRSAS